MAGKGKSKTSAAQIEVEEKQAEAVRLRKACVPYEEIARQLGYASASGAYHAVRAAMEKTLREPTDELRQLELSRLDEMAESIWENVMAGDLDSIATALKISERRAKLLGLDRRETPVVVKLPKLAKAQDAMPIVTALLEKASAGELLPEEAGRLSTLVQSFMKIAETVELAERIKVLEEQLNESV